MASHQLFAPLDLEADPAATTPVVSPTCQSCLLSFQPPPTLASQSPELSHPPRSLEEPAAKEGFSYRVIQPGSFEPTVRYFMGLSRERIVHRYCHLRPNVDGRKLTQVLCSSPKYLKWAGCDLINTSDAKGGKSMVIIETNSCPSGMKSTPLFEEMEEEGGYRTLLSDTFMSALTEGARRVPGGGLAVIYDKNPMETWGYACAMANLAGEEVHLVPMLGKTGKGGKARMRVRFVDGVMQVDRAANGREADWVNIRAALRYVTQRPWDRIPLDTRTVILNPIVACLAGGRNKSVAAKAYATLNTDLACSGLQIKTPFTVCDVEWSALRGLIKKLGGFGVIKVPYSNAGQGVYTITCEEEMLAFEEAERGSKYQRFVVQSLIANHTWSSRDDSGQAPSIYHVGTCPDKKGHLYVFDLRMMVSGGENGFRPVGVYGRKARKPLCDKLKVGEDSWEMLGTNLSVKVEEGLFNSESDRLLLVDKRDFNTLGLGLDDLIEGFIQSVLAVTAIDRMCESLMAKGYFDREMFEVVNQDPGLLSEMMDVVTDNIRVAGDGSSKNCEAEASTIVSQA